MKKILILLLLAIGLQAAINECVSDVYFGNGIDTKRREAKISSDKIKEQFLAKYPTQANLVNEWKVSYNHTHGMGIDLYESIIQKIFEDEYGPLATFYTVMDYLDYTLKGIAKKASMGLAKKSIKAFAKKMAKTIAKEAVYQYMVKYKKKLSEEAVEMMFTKIFDELLEKTIEAYAEVSEATIQAQKDKDLKEQVKAYKNSIKQGHGVIIVAHSQGNFFMNDAYKKMDNWMKKYYHGISLATPANKVLEEYVQYPYVTFDNDIIQLVPFSLETNIKNPKRYYFGPNAIGERIENTYSIEAHSFLSSYMATEETRNFILKHISKYLKNHKNEDSLWTPTGKSQCSRINGCKGKLKNVKHEKDNSLTKTLKHTKIYPFVENSMGKLYQVNGEYVKAKCGGKLIEKPEDEEVCYELKDDENKSLGKIDGCPSCKDINFTFDDIQVYLYWLDPNMDMDLKVSFPNGKYDVKNSHCLVEHFYASKDGVGEGSYPVHVTYSLEDENIKPYNAETVSVDIYVPHGNKDDRSRLVTPYVIKNLSDGGHIADIVVSKDKVELKPTDDYKQNSTVINNSDLATNYGYLHVV